MKCGKLLYSATLLFWPSGMWTLCFNGCFAHGTDCTSIHYWRHPPFCKADSPSPLYKIHSKIRMLAGLSHKIVKHCWLIQQLDIRITLVHIVLASGQPFLPSYNKGELWNVLSQQSTVHVHIATATENTLETSKIRVPPCSRHQVEGPYGVHWRGTTVTISSGLEALLSHLRNTKIASNIFKAILENQSFLLVIC